MKEAMKEKVNQCVRTACPNIDFETKMPLVDSGLLDSLAIMTIISSLIEAFNIDIDADDIVSDNFNSIDSLTVMVQKKMNL